MPSDSEFAFYIAEVLSLCNEGGANTGEVLRAATQIVPTDFESVHKAFIYMADHIHAIAKDINVTMLLMQEKPTFVHRRTIGELRST